MEDGESVRTLIAYPLSRKILVVKRSTVMLSRGESFELGNKDLKWVLRTQMKGAGNFISDGESYRAIIV